MTVTVPEELRQQIMARAAQQGVAVDELVQSALRWYLLQEDSLQGELADWQEVRDEALRIVEDAT